MTKQSPCCARRTAKLTHDEGNLRSLAIKAARADAKGRDISKFRTMIEAAKVTIVASKQAVIDHESDHADEMAFT